MIYTRYLYDKRCVEYSLLIALLHNNKDEVLFWGLELFHSGYKEELISLIWCYYYELYAPFYINLEAYLLKYTKIWMNNKLDDVSVATMLTNLCERQASIDFYLTYKNVVECPKTMSNVFKNIDDSDNIGDIYDIAINVASELRLFKTRGKNALSNINNVFETIASLSLEIYKSAIKSRLLTGLFLLDKGNKYDPKFYVKVTGDDIVKYKTRPLINLKGWKIPPRECLYTIHLKPNTVDKSISHYDNWLYFASKTPIWKKRITRHKGAIDTDNKCVSFKNVDNEEDFFNMYNYEPDEQSLQTQNKWFGVRTYESWDHIYEKHKCEPYNEWLSDYDCKNIIIKRTHLHR